MKLPHVSRAFFGTPFLAGIVVGSLVVSGAGAAMRGSAVFVDVPVGSYYDDAVGEMYATGIMKGVDAKHFDPGGYVNRAQMAVMFQRFRQELQTGSVSQPSLPPQASETASSAASSARSRRSSSSSTSTSSSSSSSSVNPTAGTIGFGVETLTISEGAPKATISVSRTGNSTGIVSVVFKTVAGTATAGDDFVDAGGRITFANGETMKTVSVSLKDDLIGEGNETFSIQLSAPEGGAAIGKSTVTVTLLDTESGGATGSSSSAASATSSVASVGSFGYSAMTYAWQENGGPVTITVNRTGGSKTAVAVNYATSNGSAKDGTDYTVATGTLNFAEGETSKTFTVPILDNSHIDGNRSFSLALSNATGGAGFSYQRSATLTIVDNETTADAAGTVQFSATNYDAIKGNDVVVTVKRVNGSAGIAAVNYTTTDGTASSNVDYRPTSGILMFAAGETSKTFTVNVLVTAKSERTINLTLTPASSNPAQLSTPSSAIMTIN